MKVNNIIKKILGISPKPVLTLTTIPTRLISDYGYDIKYCLESLLNQNYDDYEIHFKFTRLIFHMSLKKQMKSMLFLNG